MATGKKATTKKPGAKVPEKLVDKKTEPEVKQPEKVAEEVKAVVEPVIPEVENVPKPEKEVPVEAKNEPVVDNKIVEPTYEFKTGEKVNLVSEELPKRFDEFVIKEIMHQKGVTRERAIYILSNPSK